MYDYGDHSHGLLLFTVWYFGPWLWNVFDHGWKQARKAPSYASSKLRLTDLPRSSNLPTTATMVGGTQLFEGAHLTGDNTHVFLESGRCSNYVFLTQICPLWTMNVPPETWKTSISALFLVMVHISTVCTWSRTFVASSALSRLRAFCGGTLGQNLLVGGTQTFLRTGRLTDGGEV